MNPDFDLAFVIDDAPKKLIRLVSYLGTTFERLLIDLITISADTVNGSQILVPQCVEAKPRRAASEPTKQVPPKGDGHLVEGADGFAVGQEAASTSVRTLLRKLCNWTAPLEQARLAKLYPYHGKAGILTLLPRLQADGVGLVSIYNNNGSAYLQFWRSVFVRRVPNALARIEASTMSIKQGNTTLDIRDELLEELTQHIRKRTAEQSKEKNLESKQWR